ncbi:cytochrome c [Caulobacter sp. 17J65-9]|uniref:c-type cytochrome n=1 Tax=Caulobacter sp. 17J65-9 TaxID=2709382 RepID=UPI0013C86C05|nr:cytochrome c [Caulobacter sp. 17J65-9]NEX91705.1 cytochrome c [Caulobacter sp. 17J65-9]
MSNKLLVLAAACVLGATGLAAAQAGAPVSMSAQDVVATRQSALDMSAAAFGGMKGVIDAGADVKGQAFAAKGLARWAKQLPSMFPAGTGADSGVATKAKAEIWTDRAGFEKAAADYAAQTQKLAELAEANDKAGFAAQWATVRQSCGACHDGYRAK